MKNFSRALKLALRYRFTFITALLCSLGVALLWGANISVVYPFVNAVFKNQSMQDWAKSEIVEHQENISKFKLEITEQQAILAGQADDQAAQKITLAKINFLESRILAEEKSLSTLTWVEPWIQWLMPEGPFQTLIIVVGFLLVGTIIKDLFLMGNMLLVERMAQLSVFHLRTEFFNKTLNMDLGSFGEEHTSQLLSRFTHDIDAISMGINQLLGKAIREPLKMITCLAGAAFISWRLLLLSLLITPIAAILIRQLSKSIKRASRRAMEEMSKLYSLLVETLTGIKIVKAFTMEQYEQDRLQHRAKEYVRKAMKIMFYNSLIRPVTEVVGISVICFALLAGAYLVLNNETHLFGIQICERPLSVAALLVFYGLIAGVSDPARKLTDIFAQIQRAAAAADRVYTTMDRTNQIEETKNPVPFPASFANIEFDQISFAYTDSQTVLDHISLTIKQGETLAIVGSNGSGKSTLLNLLPRFYDPTAGEILIGGTSTKHFLKKELREHIGIVSQDTLLFDDTVMNNIRYGSLNATDEEVSAAAKLAHADSFISKLPGGYATSLGEAGNKLSGGQKQRIALARAILRDADILILDEATSQVDIESEQLIHQVLQKISRNKTVLMITHRLTTLALADRICVLDQGKIADLGTHEELLSRCHLYQRLYDIQFKQTA